MKKTVGLGVLAILILIGIAATPNVGQRRVGWANTVTELLAQRPSRESYVFVTVGNLYSTNFDGMILAYSPTATNAANLTNVWEPDNGVGRWFLVQGSGLSGGGSGSVALTMPAGLTVTGSPVVGSGTLAVTTVLNSIIKGTGSGFSNAVAGTDYVAPGDITGSGLTMTGTNLLGRYSSGTGIIQKISVGNGLEISENLLLNTQTNGITALTGDGTATGPGSAAFTLAATAVTNGVYGSATQSAQISVDTKGRITGATNVPIATTTINPTDGYVPYRSSATAFGDSPWYRLSATAIGFNSTTRFIHITGTENTFLGDGSGAIPMTGTGNTAVGALSIKVITSGSDNAVFGAEAGELLSTGSQNAVFGAFSLDNGIVTGTGNTIAGSYSARTITNGSYNTVIGSGSDVNGNSDTNSVVIGANAKGLGSNTAIIGTNGVSVIYLNGTVGWFRGSGSPEAAVAAPIGSFYTREDGSAQGSLYTKASGTGNTGWSVFPSVTSIGISRCGLQISNAAVTLALSTTPVILTNWTRVLAERNSLGDIAAGTITVTNAGTYLLNYGSSSSLNAASRTVTHEIYINGNGTGIRMQQNPASGILEVGRIMGLFTLSALDVLSVKISVDSTTPTLTVNEAGLNIIQQPD